MILKPDGNLLANEWATVNAVRFIRTPTIHTYKNWQTGRKNTDIPSDYTLVSMEIVNTEQHSSLNIVI